MAYNDSMNQAPIIFLHGWGMNADLFGPLLRHLPAERVAHAPNLPGYPDSPWPAATTFNRQLELMAAELPRGDLVGWSLGGLYAIELAARFPERFDSLTLIASNPCFVKREDWDCGLEPAIFDGFYTDLLRDWRRTLRRFLALQLHGEADARELARDLWQRVVARGDPDLEVLRAGLELLKQHDARPGLARLRMPCRLILGEHDRLVPLALAQQITAIAPSIRVESVAGAAHAPFIANPAVIAGHLAYAD